MSIRTFHQMILLCLLITLPLRSATAESFLDTLLRFTGISITTSQVRGKFIEGNIWLVDIDGAEAKDAKKITSDGTYHSPLWIPDSDKIITVKGKKLIRINIEESEETTLHILSDYTILLGFDKRDSNLILILQGSVPAVLSLASGQTSLLPYDKNNSRDRNALDSLMSSFRNYGNSEVFIEKQSRVDANGVFKKTNKIHIKTDEQDLVIACPAECAQPALIRNGRRLIFVGQ